MSRPLIPKDADGNPLPPPRETLYQGHPAPPLSRAQRQRFRWWYDAIIDWLLTNPNKPLNQCAKDLGRGEATIRTIMNTDIFKSRLAARRMDVNLRLADALVDTTAGVALSAMRIIQERLTENPDKIPIGVINDIGNKALERLGYGVKPIVSPATVVNTGPQITQNIVQVSPAALQEAQLKMRQLQQINSTVVEVKEYIDVPRELPSPKVSSN